MCCAYCLAENADAPPLSCSFRLSQPDPIQSQEGQTEVEAMQIGSEAAVAQTQTAPESKTVDTTLSSSVDTNASAFEIIPSMLEPELAQGENDSVQ